MATTASAWIQGFLFLMAYLAVSLLVSAFRSGWDAALGSIWRALLVGAAGAVVFGLFTRWIGKRHAAWRPGPDEET